jgi:hypothetical protein
MCPQSAIKLGCYISKEPSLIDRSKQPTLACYFFNHTEIICSFQDNQMAVDFMQFSEFLPDGVVVAACSEIQVDRADGSLCHRPLQAPHPPSTRRQKSVQAGRSSCSDARADVSSSREAMSYHNGLSLSLLGDLLTRFHWNEARY